MVMKKGRNLTKYNMASMFRLAIPILIIVKAIIAAINGFVAWLLIYLKKLKSSIGGGYNY